MRQECCKTWISCLLILLLLLGGMSVVSAATNEVFANGVGDGSPENPFELSTAADLTKLSALTNAAATNGEYGGYHYKLATDIGMVGTTGFKGLNCMDTAWNYQYFTGVFDGNGHVIKNLTIEAGTSTRSRGFISVANGAAIKNLGMENIVINGGAQLGGILGGAQGDTSTTVENCYVRGAKFTPSSAWQGCAGIAGGTYVNSNAAIVIKNCYSVHLTGANCGIVGHSVGETEHLTVAAVSDCYTTHASIIRTAAANTVVNNSYADATAATVTVAVMGAGFENDLDEINNGLPILAWEYLRAHPSASFTVGQGGRVEIDGQKIPAGSAGVMVNVPDSGLLSVSVLPEKGYETASVMVGDRDMTQLFQTTQPVSLEIAESVNITVSFRQRQVVKPTMSQTNSCRFTPDYAYGGNTYFSAVLYTSMDMGYGWTVSEVGMQLTNGDGVTLTLPAYLVPLDGKYGIRVFGAGLAAGERYEAVPYAVVQLADDPGETIYGKTETFTVPQDL